MFIGRWALHAGKQRKELNRDKLTWMGFSYGSWFPHIGIRINPYFNFTWYWFCFHGHLTEYPKQKK